MIIIGYSLYGVLIGLYCLVYQMPTENLGLLKNSAIYLLGFIWSVVFWPLIMFGLVLSVYNKIDGGI